MKLTELSIDSYYSRNGKLSNILKYSKNRSLVPSKNEHASENEQFNSEFKSFHRGNVMYSNNHKNTVRLLYKTILRLHRGLPEELRLLGTLYVRDEFRRHKNCDEQTAAVFITQWAEYASLLTKQISVKGLVHSSKLGRPIDESILDMMREEQIAQLYELMKAATSPE